MKKAVFLLLLTIWAVDLAAQVVSTSPVFPKPDLPLTITVDVTGTSLDHFAWDNANNPVYIWTWYKKNGASVDAPTNINPATSFQAGAKCNRISTNPDQYQITFTPTTFLNAPASDLSQIGLKLKSRDWNENKQTDNDRYITFSQGFSAIFTQPTASYIFKNQSETIPITIVSSAPANVVLSVDGVVVASSNSVLQFQDTITATQSFGTVVVQCVVTNVSTNEVKTLSFTYSIRTPTVNEARPAGILDGTNYSSDPARATLSLWAPGKSSVYVIGDFNDWQIDAGYQMKRDGEHFWLEVSGLTPGTEYGFQYYVDESLKIADPYANKILDPDDQYIPESTYPNLIAYPAKALNDQWYFNRVAVLQTGQQPYAWQTVNYQKPIPGNLLIYELLIRDFLADGQRNYQNLIDTLGYFKRLGINAIELMPIMEFNGNDSWGYNPTFMFAPDKYYGTKNKLKEFIDKCHQQGIAVILDIVMNHQDIPNSYAMMNFDFVAFKPTPDNPWFNVNATHPYNVFFDLNHESNYTKTYLDTVNYYWLHEYKVDGFRFDLAKGFTQRNSGNNVDYWSSYDQSRIDILDRMAKKIRSHTADAYIILEQFAANAEEVELAADSMMLWGNANASYAQNTMGYTTDSDIAWGYYKTRGWAAPRLVTYMESHDEERLMYKNLQYGNSSGSYDAKTLSLALSRMKAANLFFLTLPGPKLIWQFGELGYDQSINLCPDNTVNSSCRVAAKPVLWDYQTVPARQDLFIHISDLLRLRKTYPVFTTGDADFSGGNALVKLVRIRSIPYTPSPSNASEMNIQLLANFDVIPANVTFDFPHSGTWYDYYEHGKPLDAPGTQTIALDPGAYKLFTDVQIENPIVTGVTPKEKPTLVFYPNPANDVLTVELDNAAPVSLTLRTLQGSKISPPLVSPNSWDIHELSRGMYLAEIRTVDTCYWVKMIKK